MKPRHVKQLKAFFVLTIAIFIGLQILLYTVAKVDLAVVYFVITGIVSGVVSASLVFKFYLPEPSFL